MLSSTLRPLLWFLFLCPSAAVLMVNSTRESPQDTTNPNKNEVTDEEFIDNLFDSLRSRLYYNHQTLLPVADIAFLKQGQFSGIESIHRQGLVRNHSNDTLELSATIDDPRVIFNWTSSFWFSHTEGSVILRAQQLPVSLTIQKTSSSTADLLLCDLPRLQGVWVDIAGAGMLNFLTGRFATVILGVTRSKLLSKIQDPVCEAIATYIG